MAGHWPRCTDPDVYGINLPKTANAATSLQISFFKLTVCCDVPNMVSHCSPLARKPPKSTLSLSFDPPRSQRLKVSAILGINTARTWCHENAYVLTHNPIHQLDIYAQVYVSSATFHLLTLGFLLTTRWTSQSLTAPDEASLPTVRSSFLTTYSLRAGVTSMLFPVTVMGTASVDMRRALDLACMGLDC